MKIYYAIVQIIDVDDNLNDSEIQDIIGQIADGKDFVWSEYDDLLWNE
jgi:hypothetical protein